MQQQVTYEQVLELIADQARENKRLAQQAALGTAELKKSLDKTIKDLGRKIADLGDTLGEFAEDQVKPRALQMFREKGLVLNELHPRVRKEDAEGFAVYEIDLLLVNTTFAVAIEVKNTMRQKDVEAHLKRLEKMQQFPLRTFKGAKLLGAVAGMSMTKEVEFFAMKNGLFVIRPKGDSVEIINQPGFQPQAWETN